MTGGTRRHGVGWWWFKFNLNLKIQTNSNIIQIDSKFDPTKKDLPALKTFEIKCGYEGFEERKIFIHMYISRFRMDLKLKFREVSRFRIQ
jgi:hypothetical protein